MPANDAAIGRLMERARVEVTDRHLPSCQVAVALDGKVLASETFGAPAQSRYVLFSVTKAISAGTIAALVFDGRMALDLRAAEHIPEFDRAGFDRVTVEHLLTHTAGFPNAPMRPGDARTRAGRRARFAQWRLDWEPGEDYRYHPTSALWVLAEMVEVTTGRRFRDVVHEDILDPLGLDRIRLGVPLQDQDDIRLVHMVGAGEEPAFRLGNLFPEADPAVLMRYADPEVLEVGVPGSGGVGTAEQMALYLQAWLHPQGAPWSVEAATDATCNVRVTAPDPITHVAANRTLVFVVAGDDGNSVLRELGPAVSPRAFGVAGLGGQQAWADPETGLTYCFLTDGLDHDVVRTWKGGYELSALAAACAS